MLGFYSLPFVPPRFLKLESFNWNLIAMIATDNCLHTPYLPTQSQCTPVRASTSKKIPADANIQSECCNQACASVTQSAKTVIIH